LFCFPRQEAISGIQPPPAAGNHATRNGGGKEDILPEFNKILDQNRRIKRYQKGYLTLL
jgi:hypothetical protein